MYNSFAKYEQDFRQWKDADFPDVGPLTRDFLEHLKALGKLWAHQKEAIFRAIYVYELLQMRNVLLNIVTGGGKTAIIGAIISWLKTCHNIHKFLVLCPNTIVRDRLEYDFRNTKVFREFGFFPSGCEHYTNDLGLHLMEPGSAPQGILENGIILGNIHQLYPSNINGKRNLAYIMNYVEEIAIFNDEAHNTPAPEYDSVLHLLSKKVKFRLDTTATPDRADGKTPDSKMIFEYSIADAQAEVPPIIKSVVVYQPKVSFVQLTYTSDKGEKRTIDEMDEEFEKIEKGLTSTQWVTDPDPMRKQIKIALDRLDEQKRRADTLAGGKYRPILFVVAICIKDAESARDMLEKEFNVKTLLVTEKSDEEDREAARILGKKDSPYDAVVSVLMLREGWDVPEVCVILLLRKFSSRVYGQQVIGRGLRLNVREEDTQEFCAMVDHEKLDHQWLWDIVGAKVKKDIVQGTLFGIEDDLPPKRKPQILVNPDLLIQIPEPTGDEDTNFLDDLENIEVIQDDYPNWKEILAGFEYGPEVEISRVEIEKVLGQKLADETNFIELIEAPGFSPEVRNKPEENNEIILGEKLKGTIRDIGSDLLAEEGIGSDELGYFYGVLMDHIREKFLDGKTVGTATLENMKHALNHRHTLFHNFKDKPGLVTSIVKYKKELNYANK
ncbi:MAG: DEAD/DEAH box helicase family protein [Elusimicrobiota bacterium]